MRRLLFVLAILSLIAAGCGDADPGPASRRAPGPAPSGPPAGRDSIAADAAPDFSITTFTGDRFSLGEQRGTPVVLNFWESW